MNLTFHEGKARSLASDISRSNGVIEQIQNNAHYCGLMYRQHLANRLKEADFPLRLSGDGLFEIDGIPEKVLQGFLEGGKTLNVIWRKKAGVVQKCFSGYIAHPPEQGRT